MQAFSSKICVWLVSAVAALIVVCWLGDVPAAIHPKHKDVPAAAPVKKSPARSKHTPALHFFFDDDPPAAELPTPETDAAADEGAEDVKLPGHVPPECRALAEGVSALTEGVQQLEERGVSGAVTRAGSHARGGTRRRLQDAPEDGRIRKYGGVFLDSNDFVPPTSPAHARTLLRLLTPQRNTSCVFLAMACGPAGKAVGLSLHPGAWGTCAMVGLGGNLLDNEYGPAIDAHDTVIRFGSAPTRGFEKHVGRRTSINFVRETLEAEAGWQGRAHTSGASRRNVRGSDVWDQAGSWHTPESLYLYQGSAIQVATLHELPYLHINTISYQDAGTHCYTALKEFVVPGSDNAKKFPDKLKPTEGMRLVLALLHSGLCTRLDLFGFSRSGAGHYFSGVSSNRNDARSGFVWKHVAALEYYVYEVAMANSLLCVFE
eukprot:jgi/Mesvir1/3926/Mv19866-RA.1